MHTRFLCFVSILVVITAASDCVVDPAGNISTFKSVRECLDSNNYFLYNRLVLVPGIYSGPDNCDVAIIAGSIHILPMYPRTVTFVCSRGICRIVNIDTPGLNILAVALIIEDITFVGNTNLFTSSLVTANITYLMVKSCTFTNGRSQTSMRI